MLIDTLFGVNRKTIVAEIAEIQSLWRNPA
jgi:hypothetical protein